MKSLFRAFCFALLFSSVAQAQTWVSDQAVTGAQYANDIYYSLSNGKVKEAPRDNWHLGFQISSNSSIIVNNGANVKAFRTNYAAAQWAQMDTAGALTSDKQLWNVESDWSIGALNSTASASNPFDIGWALYDVNTHILTGDSLYFLLLPDGSVKKFWLKQRASGVYTFAYADADGSNEKTGEINTASFKVDTRSKNFAYFNFLTNEVVDREPFSDEWDLLFTRYFDLVNNQGAWVPYGVTGVKSNTSAPTIKFANTNVDLELDTTDISDWNPSATNIGYDWKTFNGQQFVLEDSLFWVVYASDDTYWKIYFDAFSGGTTGTYSFKKQKLTFETTARNDNQSFELSVSPNPAADRLQLNWDAAKFVGQGSLRIVDLVGRVWFETAIDATTGFYNLDLNAPNGLYLVETSLGGSKNVQRLVIVN